MRGEFLVAIFRVAGDPDRADDLAIEVADLQAAAFGENLVAGCGTEIAHENRLLFGSHLYELG